MHINRIAFWRLGLWLWKTLSRRFCGIYHRIQKRITHNVFVLPVDFGILIVYLWFHCAEIAVKSQLTWLTICIRVILLSVSLWKRSLVESWCTVEIAAKGMAYAYRYTFLDRQDFIGYAMWLSWRAMAVRRIRLRCVRMTATCSERLYHKSQRRIVHSFCRAPHRPHELPISWFWLSDATLQ